MWNKNKKILKTAAPFLEEGILLLHPDLRIEPLTDATCHFLKLPKGKEGLSLVHIPDSSVSKKIELMLCNAEELGNVSYLDKNIIIKISEVEGSKCRLIMIKDDSGQEKILNMGKEFVGNASHELRTPITIIKGFTELLLETDEIEKDMQKSILAKVFANCNRMEHLVNHLLRLTDLEHCSVQSFTEVDVHRLVEDVSYQVISIYPEVRIEHLRTDDPAIAFVDGDLIELVLTNLFKNAVKYSKDEKVITVKVDTSGEDIYIQVQDKGIGIPEKDLEKIFERFYTVNKAHCRKLGGAGLGLSIVKLIVEKHKGKIYATSQPGLSTTMHLYLPKVHKAAQASLV